MHIDQLKAGALALAPIERAPLVERLIASFGVQPDIEKEWMAEVERRDAELETGAVQALPGPETLAGLRAEFK